VYNINSRSNCCWLTCSLKCVCVCECVQNAGKRLAIAAYDTKPAMPGDYAGGVSQAGSTVFVLGLGHA